MKLTDFNPKHISTKNLAQVDESAPTENSLVRIPGMGVVHIGALQINIANKLKDLVAMVESGGSDAIIEAHRLMHTPSFNAMFEALAKAHEDIIGLKK
jgi:hypothetical protein